MTEYRLSQKADEDLSAIYKFSYLRFGETKADAYLTALDERFCQLANQPDMGKPINYIRNGYYRYEHVSHSIFYKRSSNGITVIRVLHNGMDAKRHL